MPQDLEISCPKVRRSHSALMRRSLVPMISQIKAEASEAIRKATDEADAESGRGYKS
jgi:hypothetical protein